MPPITARYRWTLETLMTGQRHAAKYTRGLLIFRIVFAVAVMVLGLLFLLDGKLSPVTAGAIIASSVGLGLLLKSSRTRRQFAQRPDANQEVIWTASDAGIHIVTPLTNSEVQWSAFQIVEATRDGFLFMPNRQVFNFIPNNAFETPADIENLKTLARQHAREFKELK